MYPPPPLCEMIQLGVLPFHSVVRHLHCHAVRSPSCDFYLLEKAPKFRLPHASKCSPYPVLSLCIHFTHTVHLFPLLVHGRKRNLGSFIFPGCGPCTCLFLLASCPHISANPSLSCFPLSIIFQNMVWHMFQEPHHKLDEQWMVVFWVWRLSSLPLWCLIFSYISCWRWLRVRVRWNLDSTGKNSFGCILPPWTLQCWVAQLFTLYWLFHLIGMSTKPNKLLRHTYLINTPKPAVGNILGPLFVKSLGPSHWLKNSLVSYNTFQVMREHLIRMNFDFNALI